MKAPVRIFLSLTTTFGLVTGEASAQTIQPGGSYSPDARLSSPFTGVSFQLPSGYSAARDDELGGLLAESSVGVLGGVWGWSEGTVEEVAEEVGRRLEAAGFTLQVRGEPQVTPDRLSGVFDAETGGDRGVLHAAIRRNARGGIVAVAALAEPSGDAQAQSFVESVVQSLQWSAPGAAAWRQEVAGAVLTWRGGGSDVSTGATTATGASSSSATLSFCSLTQYRYEESSESYVSIPGASASSSSSDEHTGEWWLVADLAGTPTLLLDATDGRSFRWSVEESGDDFLIDGYRYAVTGTC